MEERNFDQDWQATCLIANLSEAEMKWRGMLRYWMFQYDQEKKRAQQAEADNAALLEGLRLCEKLKTQAVEVGSILEGVHDNTWQKIQELNATYNTISNLINADHPGDVLLRELEGLRRVKEAAAEFISKLQGCLDSKICNINECYICEHDNEPAIEALKLALAGAEKEGKV